jgi:hypothetical protein
MALSPHSKGSVDMGKPRGVKAETVELPLSDGDVIVVKKILTAGEANVVTSGSVEGYSRNGDRVEFDNRKLGFLAAAVYIISWSLTNVHDGLPIYWPSEREKRISVLETLDEDTGREINEAIGKHRKALQEAREKNATNSESGTGTSSLSANSPGM